VGVTGAGAADAGAVSAVVGAAAGTGTADEVDASRSLTIYPTARAPGTCEPVGGSSGGNGIPHSGGDSGGDSVGCCSASRGAERLASALLLAGAVAFLLRRPGRSGRPAPGAKRRGHGTEELR
jgi:hypothetical protein